MKIFIPSIFLLATGISVAQSYCVPPGAVPYNADQPGITNVTLNTINRTSLDIENFPNNSYVMTTSSTSLTKGNTYPISITHTRDANLFPNVQNNIRVWIDLNQDGQLDDPGETLLSMDLQTFGTTMGNITIPTSATTGNTRMRVTIKMSSQGGHTLPTACDVPADPLGYHGEIEDYTVNLLLPSGVEEFNVINAFDLSPNPAANGTAVQMNFSLENASHVDAAIFNLAGEKVAQLLNKEFAAGSHTNVLSTDGLNLGAGVYFVRLNAGGAVLTKRLILVN